MPMTIKLTAPSNQTVSITMDDPGYIFDLNSELGKTPGTASYRFTCDLGEQIDAVRAFIEKIREVRPYRSIQFKDPALGIDITALFGEMEPQYVDHYLQIGVNLKTLRFNVIFRNFD